MTFANIFASLQRGGLTALTKSQTTRRGGRRRGDSPGRRLGAARGAAVATAGPHALYGGFAPALTPSGLSGGEAPRRAVMSTGGRRIHSFLRRGERRKKYRLLAMLGRRCLRNRRLMSCGHAGRVSSRGWLGDRFSLQRAETPHVDVSRALHAWSGDESVPTPTSRPADAKAASRVP